MRQDNGSVAIMSREKAQQLNNNIQDEAVDKL